MGEEETKRKKGPKKSKNIPLKRAKKVSFGVESPAAGGYLGPPGSPGPELVYLPGLAPALAPALAPGLKLIFRINYFFLHFF